MRYMSDPTLREWRFYIDDMIAFAEKVIAYTDGLDQERFVLRRGQALAAPALPEPGPSTAVKWALWRSRMKMRFS